MTEPTNAELARDLVGLLTRPDCRDGEADLIRIAALRLIEPGAAPFALFAMLQAFTPSTPEQERACRLACEALAGMNEPVEVRVGNIDSDECPEPVEVWLHSEDREKYVDARALRRPVLLMPLDE